MISKKVGQLNVDSRRFKEGLHAENHRVTRKRVVGLSLLVENALDSATLRNGELAKLLEYMFFFKETSKRCLQRLANRKIHGRRSLARRLRPIALVNSPIIT